MKPRRLLLSLKGQADLMGSTDCGAGKALKAVCNCLRSVGSGVTLSGANTPQCRA